MSRKDYQLITRRDLSGFDAESKKLLLEAQELGGRIRLTSNGHAFVYGPQGGTCTVPPNLRSGNRSAQNTRSDLRRLGLLK